jgi:hypothetical protein
VSLRTGQETSITEARRLLGDGLRERKPAMEQEMFARVGLFSLGAGVDPAYGLGLKESISIALEYGICCIESSERTVPPIPLQLYMQARLAARNGVDVETVLSRYLAGYTLLDVFLEEAAKAEGLVGSTALREIRRVSSLVIDRFIREICEQHSDELRKQTESPEFTRLRAIRDLLEGKQIDTARFNYAFDGFHIGLIGNGTGAASAINGLAKTLDCIALTVSFPGGPTWAWLGRRETPDIDRIEKLVDKHWPSESALALGEVNQGLAGWRLTHQQAEAGFLVSLKRGGFFRYGDNPLLAALLGNPVLGESFRQMYLKPLLRARNGGQDLIRTLRVYSASECNGASASIALKVTRQTVKNRLQTVENQLGRPLLNCMTHLEAALQLDELDQLT